MNRCVLEMMKAMMYHARASVYFWSESALTAFYVLDRRISAADAQKTPIELWDNKKPNIENLHVFGCDVFYHNQNKEGKLDVTGKKGIFLGYDKYNDTYFRIYDVENEKVIITHDVKFFDNDFTMMKSPRQEQDV